MRYRLPLSTSRARGLLAALAIVFTITSAALAQFGGFDPSFDGELWTVRHQLTIADDGVPAGLAFSGGTLFVADSAHHSIVGYNTAGAIVSQWDLTASPASDLVPNQLTATVINVDGADRDALLLSDRESNRVAAFAAADGTYLFTLRLARPANEPTYALSTGQTALSAGAKFNFTSSPPALTLTGNFAAAWREQWLTGPVDSGVLAFDGAASVFQLDGSEFVGTASIVLNGTEGNPVAPAPQNFFGVTFDTAGNLYALDAFTERLHVYSAAFTRLFTFGTPVAGGGTAEFYEPWGLAFWPDASGSSGRLLINDTYNSRVMIYRPIDGADADAVVDGLQFETTIADFVAPNPPIELFSIAVDSATDTIAVSDFAELYENAVPRVVVLQRPRLATFNVQLLDADNQVISNVCAGTTFKVRFSLTVPAGLADVKKVEPTLLIDGVATAVVPEPAAVYPSTTLAAGQVMTFTYSLPGITEDAQLVAGATASNTDDVMFRSLTAFVAHCDDETDPTSIDAVPNVPSQVSGWTPVRENQTYSIDLNAQDDDGIELLEYQLTGATQTPGVISTTFEEVLDQAQVTVPVPDVGRSTLRYRGRDGNGIWSAWQTFEIRTKTVFDRITNENVAVEFRVGDPEGVGFTYSVSGLPDGVTFSPDTGQFAGVVSYDAVLPYSSDPVLSSGVHTVVVTEIAPGGSTSSVSFTWTINHINREPIITTVPGALSIQQGQLFELDIDGYDPDGDPTVFTIVGRSPSGRELPSSITIDRNTGFISGIFPLDSDTSYDIIVGLAECSAITSPPCEQTPPGERLATLLGFTLAVLDANLPADVVNPGAQVSAEGAAVSLQITASDPESDTLTYTAGGLPPGLSIDPNTGLITGIVSYDAAGAHAVTVVVDDHVNTPPRAVTFAWTVTNTNRPPVVSIPDQVGVETQVFTAGTSLAQYVADPDGLPVTFVSVSGLPDGISIAPNGEIAGQFDYDDAGVYTVTVTVSDGALTTTADFTWTVHNVNRAPVLVVANRSSREGDVVSYLLPASDPDGDQLFFTATGLPPGVTLNESSGLISGAFPAGSAGVYQVNIGVKDLIPTGSSPILVSFTWTIRIPNRPPDVVNPGNQLSSEGAIVTLPIAALDPDGDVLSYEVTGLPAGLSMNAAGVITGSPEYNTAGSHTVTVRAIDADGASDAETFTWVINNVNRAPIAIDDAATVVQLAAVAIDVLANDSDPDGTAPTVVSVTAPTSGTAVVNPLTGVITFTATSAAFTGVSTFSYTVSDGTSTALATVRVTILPNNAPPVCSAATGGEIWPPNHKRFYVAAINGLSDPDGDPIAINVTGIWQDEPIDSTGDGKFAPDGYIADGQAWVRAERNGHGNKAKGNGRVYEIFFTAADNKGGSCSGSVFWTVPHDQGQRSTAIDDGVRYDSTGAIAGARNKSQIHQKSAKP